MFYVYRIKIEGTTRYIGHTNDIKRREREHNRSCFKTDDRKILYSKIKSETTYGKISLETIKQFTTKTEAKRYEAFLILYDHFTKKQLWQKVPNISDR